MSAETCSHENTQPDSGWHKDPATGQLAAINGGAPICRVCDDCPAVLPLAWGYWETSPLVALDDDQRGEIADIIRRTFRIARSHEDAGRSSMPITVDDALMLANIAAVAVKDAARARREGER